MRKHIKYLASGALAVMVLTLVSCLKEDDIPDFTKVDPVIEFPLGGPGLRLNSLSAFSTAVVDTSIAVYIASPDPLKADINVKVEEDPASVDAYNAQKGTTYIAAPANYYSIESKEVIIKAGYRVGRIKIKIYFDRFDLSQKYMLSLKIIEAPGMIISGNFGKFLWAFNVRNPYEGNYHETGQIILYNGTTPASGVADTRTFDRSISATTIDASTIQTNIADLGNYMNLQVNNSTGEVTVSPASSNSFAVVQNSGTCTYNTGTRTFTLNYQYYNSSGNLREVTQTMVRQ